MSRKSFMRGFGVGILFAAAILGVSFMIRTSDSSVIKRAEKLGMVFEKDSDSAIALPTTTPKVKGKASAAPVSSSAPKVTEFPSTTPKPTQKATMSKEKINALKKEQAAKDKAYNAEKKKLTIKSGDWSEEVSKKLKSMGAIENADSFNDYLKKNGYSSNISTGTYEISLDSTYQEIAKEITGGK